MGFMMLYKEGMRRHGATGGPVDEDVVYHKGGPENPVRTVCNPPFYIIINSIRTSILTNVYIYKDVSCHISNGISNRLF